LAAEQTAELIALDLCRGFRGRCETDELQETLSPTKFLDQAALADPPASLHDHEVGLPGIEESTQFGKLCGPAYEFGQERRNSWNEAMDLVRCQGRHSHRTKSNFCDLVRQPVILITAPKSLATQGFIVKMAPLTALRAFECLDRIGSVKGAPEELGVSAGAITQQIHALEKYLKIRLVQRSGRGIELTVWGKLYLPRLKLRFDELHRAHEDLERGVRSDHLMINTYLSLATKWLSPLMFKFKNRHPAAGATITGVHPEPRLEDGEADFRISYGCRSSHHTRHIHLFVDQLMVVASPSLVARVGYLSSARELLNWPLLWVDWGKEEALALPSWHDWFGSVGVKANSLRQDLLFSLPGAAVDAAIESQGFALVQHSLAASALARGTLVHVMPPTLPLPEAHFLAWSSAALDRPPGAEFRAWIVNEARYFDSRA